MKHLVLKGVVHQYSTHTLEHVNCWKSQTTINTDITNIKDWNLEDTYEIELVKIISKFSSVIEESARLNRIHNIAQYSQDLASAFNKFYKSVPVIDSEKEDLRLFIVDKSRITIHNCLKLMGIEAPESM